MDHWLKQSNICTVMFHEEISVLPSRKSQQLNFLSFSHKLLPMGFYSRVQYFCCYLVFVGIQIIKI